MKGHLAQKIPSGKGVFGIIGGALFSPCRLTTASEGLFRRIQKKVSGK